MDAQFYETLETAVLTLAESLADRLPADLVAESVAFAANHGEYGIAFEYLIYGLPHHHVVLREEDIVQMRYIGRLMNMQKAVTAVLKSMDVTQA